MTDLDLELLSDWAPEPVTPSTATRDLARARLESEHESPRVTTTSNSTVGRRVGRRLAIAALAVVVVIAGTLIWVQREVDDRLDNLKTVAVPKGSLGDGAIGKGPVNILVVGSDSRSGTDPNAFGTPEETGPPRSDTAFLLRIDGPSVRALWIPRDLEVNVDGQPALINSALNTGPQHLIDTIRTELGVTVDHYVEVDFNSFPRVVDAVGGVRVFSPGQVRDEFSGLRLAAGGCQKLDGNTALAWVRSRHLEVYQPASGEWADASPRADLDRGARQQDFIRELARQAQRKADGDPVAAVRIADAVLPALRLDQSFKREEVFALVKTLLGFDMANAQMSTMPVQDAGDGVHLALRQPDADAALAPFRGGTAPSGPPRPAYPGDQVAPTPAC
jgi:LCP family protein required for cell wall assembly